MTKAEKRYGDRVGETFGLLTLTGISDQTGDGARVYGSFRCACGTERAYPLGRVVRCGYRTHCGCLADLGSGPRTHGMRHSKEYTAWTGMKMRCLNQNEPAYRRYGGAGITVHPEWVGSFEAFYAHIGPASESSASVDRIDTTGHYVPGNVRWATKRQQAENTRRSWTVDIRGSLYASVEEAGRAHGVSAMSVVRWCDGFRDSRRDTFTAPRSGCRRWRTYQ